jgi:hypothetical protein
VVSLLTYIVILCLCVTFSYFSFDIALNKENLKFWMINMIFTIYIYIACVCQFFITVANTWKKLFKEGKIYFDSLCRDWSSWSFWLLWDVVKQNIAVEEYVTEKNCSPHESWEAQKRTRTRYSAPKHTSSDLLPLTSPLLWKFPEPANNAIKLGIYLWINPLTMAEILCSNHLSVIGSTIWAPSVIYMSLRGLFHF